MQRCMIFLRAQLLNNCFQLCLCADISVDSLQMIWLLNNCQITQICLVLRCSINFFFFLLFFFNLYSQNRFTYCAAHLKHLMLSEQRSELRDPASVCGLLVPPSELSWPPASTLWPVRLRSRVNYCCPHSVGGFRPELSLLMHPPCGAATLLFLAAHIVKAASPTFWNNRNGFRSWSPTSALM